jgi:tetratricopeptide (TPR) repeat protein
LIDVGNQLSSRGRHQQALSVYRLALRLAPDVPIRLMALISYSAVLVRIGALEEAIRILEGILEKVEDHLHLKYESACHYNLGVAYMRMGRESRAVREFNQAIDAWPLSPYAQLAKVALERRRPKDHPTSTDVSDNEAQDRA